MFCPRHGRVEEACRYLDTAADRSSKQLQSLWELYGMMMMMGMKMTTAMVVRELAIRRALLLLHLPVTSSPRREIGTTKVSITLNVTDQLRPRRVDEASSRSSSSRRSRGRYDDAEWGGWWMVVAQTAQSYNTTS